MDQAAWVAVSTSLLTVVLIPLIILLFRLTIKATQLTDKVNNIDTDLKELVNAKNRADEAMVGQMREDRNATNIRLRWLEEHYWKEKGT